MSEVMPRERTNLLRPAEPVRPMPESDIVRPNSKEANTVPPDVVAPNTVTPVKERRRWLRPLLFLLLPLALLAGGYEYVEGGAVMSTENAYVRADILAVSTDVSGLVKEVDVHDNELVKPGDVLFKLDDLPYRLALERAQAQLGIVAAGIDALKASYRDMQAQIQQGQVDVDFYAKELDRQNKLLASSVSSVVTFEQAQRNLMTSKQHVASLQQQLAGIVANLGGNPDIAITAHPRMVEAVAARDEAARQLGHTVVVAPMAGIVTNVPSLQPGQYLPASMAGFSLVSTDHMWIDAEPKETELTWVQPGQDVSIAVDTYPGQSWHGVVDSIGPASASSFAMLPAQNTSGNWVKVVQRNPMRVRIDTPPGKPQLRAGMSAVIDVETGHARGLPSFLQPVLGWAFPRSGRPVHA